MLKSRRNQSIGRKQIYRKIRKLKKKVAYLSARKLTETLFRDGKGVLMMEFMQQKTTITSEMYCEILRDCVGLFRAIQNKSCGMLTSGVVFLHDNARPHTSTAAETSALL
jgi:hypothetical protein